MKEVKKRIHFVRLFLRRDNTVILMWIAGERAICVRCDCFARRYSAMPDGHIRIIHHRYRCYGR